MASSPNWLNNLVNCFAFLSIASLLAPVGLIFGLLNEWNWFYDVMIGFNLFPPYAMTWKFIFNDQLYSSTMPHH